MANRKNTFLLKRSNVVNKIPSLGDIQLGELALNTADAKLFSTYTGGLTGATEIREIGWDRLSTISGGTVNGDVTINANLTVTGDTQLVNVSGTSFYTDYIDFNNTLSPLPTDIEGRIYWDSDNGTLSLGMEGGNVVQQVGLEQYYYIKNQSGATISNGRVVRAAGTLGSSGRILGEYMIADGTIPAKFTLGIATEDIINGDDGYVTEFGLVRGINTTGSLYGESWSAGTVLYVSSIIPGGLTSVEPQAPNLKIEMAIVIDADSNGSIFVRPNRYPYLYDLQQVNYSAGTENNLDILQWNDSNKTWDKTNTPSFQELTITNGLSACTGIYTSNIYSCSPLNINPNDEGNVYFGSTSGVTIDLINNRLGVNTSSPTQKVHIDEGILRIENSNPDLSTINSVRENGIRLDAGSTSSYAEIRPYNGPNNTRIGLSFWTSNPTPTEVVRIQPNGNVGIGTNTPSEKLEVDGNAIINGNLGVTGTVNIGTLGTGTSINTLGIDSNGYVVSGNTTSSESIFISYFNVSNGALADGTTYCIGQQTTLQTSPNSIAHIPLPAGTITEAYIECYVASTLASGENITVNFLSDGGATSNTLSSTVTATSRHNEFIITGLSISINASRTFITIDCPTFTTNPTAVQFRVGIKLEL